MPSRHLRLASPRTAHDAELQSGVIGHLRLAGCAAALGLTLLLSACGGTESAAGSGSSGGNGAAEAAGVVLPVARRVAAPTIVGTTLDGKTASLSGLRGEVVVLNTWGSWCAPCRAEAPVLQSVYSQTRSRGVAFLGINVRDNDAAARAFQRTFSVTYPSIPDSDGQIIARFRQLPPNAIPTTLILDRQGRVAARIIGGTVEAQLKPAVLALASEAGGSSSPR